MGDTVRHSGTRWDTVGHSGTQWDTVRHSGTQWDTVGHSETQWDTVGHSGTQWDTVSHCIPLCLYISLAASHQYIPVSLYQSGHLPPIYPCVSISVWLPPTNISLSLYISLATPTNI